jgi:LysM repeat protein
VEALRDANGLRRKSTLQIGQMLMIPVAGGASPEAAHSKPSYMNSTSAIDRAALERYAARASASAAVPAGKKKLVYVVKPNDTLSEIADRYGTSASRIRSWNDLSRRRHIYPGQKLAIYVAASYDEPESRETVSVTTADESRFEKTKHVVERGQTFYSIARIYNVSMHDLMSWNGRTRSTLRPGDVLVVYTPRGASIDDRAR